MLLYAGEPAAVSGVTALFEAYAAAFAADKLLLVLNIEEAVLARELADPAPLSKSPCEDSA